MVTAARMAAAPKVREEAPSVSSPGHSKVLGSSYSSIMSMDSSRQSWHDFLGYPLESLHETQVVAVS